MRPSGLVVVLNNVVSASGVIVRWDLVRGADQVVLDCDGGGGVAVFEALVAVGAVAEGA